MLAAALPSWVGAQSGWWARVPSGLPGQEAAKAPECLLSPFPPPPGDSAVRGWTVSVAAFGRRGSVPAHGPKDTGALGPPARGLAGGDGGPAAQAHEHLLAVVQQAAIAELLERARRLSQHAHALPWSRQEAGGQVAGGQ